MDIRRVDISATQGKSALHRCRPGIKLVAFAFTLSAVIMSVNLLVVVGLALCLVGVIAAMRLPARPMLALAAYPGLFAALFAFAAAADRLTGALVVAKAVTAGLAAVLLMFTTPYPQVFAPVQRFLPPVIGDALLMTYRSLFLLLEKFGHVLTAARLRAGLLAGSPIRSAKAATRSLGTVLLYSIDLSQRTYDVMHLRGYDGRLVVSQQAATAPVAEVALLAAAVVVVGTAGLWRVTGSALAPFAWIPLGVGVGALIVGTVAGLLTAKETR